MLQFTVHVGFELGSGVLGKLEWFVPYQYHIMIPQLPIWYTAPLQLHLGIHSVPSFEFVLHTVFHIIGKRERANLVLSNVIINKNLSESRQAFLVLLWFRSPQCSLDDTVLAVEKSTVPPVTTHLYKHTTSEKIFHICAPQTQCRYKSLTDVTCN